MTPTPLEDSPSEEFPMGPRQSQLEAELVRVKLEMAGELSNSDNFKNEILKLRSAVVRLAEENLSLKQMLDRREDFRGKLESMRTENNRLSKENTYLKQLVQKQQQQQEDTDSEDERPAQAEDIFTRTELGSLRIKLDEKDVSDLIKRAREVEAQASAPPRTMVVWTVVSNATLNHDQFYRAQDRASRPVYFAKQSAFNGAPQLISSVTALRRSGFFKILSSDELPHSVLSASFGSLCKLELVKVLGGGRNGASPKRTAGKNDMIHPDEVHKLMEMMKADMMVEMQRKDKRIRELKERRQQGSEDESDTSSIESQSEGSISCSGADLSQEEKVNEHISSNNVVCIFNDGEGSVCSGTSRSTVGQKVANLAFRSDSEWMSELDPKARRMLECIKEENGPPKLARSESVRSIRSLRSVCSEGSMTQTPELEIKTESLVPILKSVLLQSEAHPDESDDEVTKVSPEPLLEDFPVGGENGPHDDHDDNVSYRDDVDEEEESSCDEHEEEKSCYSYRSFLLRRNPSFRVGRC